MDYAQRSVVPSCRRSSRFQGSTYTIMITQSWYALPLISRPYSIRMQPSSLEILLTVTVDNRVMFQAWPLYFVPWQWEKTLKIEDESDIKDGSCLLHEKQIYLCMFTKDRVYLCKNSHALELEWPPKPRDSQTNIDLWSMLLMCLLIFFILSLFRANKHKMRK